MNRPYVMSVVTMKVPGIMMSHLCSQKYNMTSTVLYEGSAC